MIPFVVYYLKSGLSATPVVLDDLMKRVPSDLWDERMDPDRFTLREVIAHLADWEAVWIERITRIRDENKPFLPTYDEGDWAIDHDYANTIVPEQFERFQERRAELVALLEELGPEDWFRIGNRAEFGPISIFEMCSMVLGHDGYHLRQIIEYQE